MMKEVTSLSDVLKAIAEVYEPTHVKPLMGQIWVINKDLAFICTGETWVQLIDPS